MGTLLILIATGLVSWRGFRDQALVDRFIFEPASILGEKEYYRLITSGFLHADWWHLGFNMFSFYAFGRAIESGYGFSQLALVYFGSIVGGSLLALFLHRNHEYRALGASGGVCGVIFAAIFLLPGSAIVVFPLPFPVAAWIYAPLFLLGSYLGIRRQSDNIGHDAHLGGALAGMLMAAALDPKLVATNLWLFLSVAGLGFAIVVCLWLNPLFLRGVGFFQGGLKLFKRAKGSSATSTAVTESKVDRILEKVASSGVHSLTRGERKLLGSYSQTLRQKTGAGK